MRVGPGGKPTMSYITVVSQPFGANVFLVTTDGERKRLCQASRDYCAAFAAGYITAQNLGLDNYIRKYRCEAGDAATQLWDVESE